MRQHLRPLKEKRVLLVQLNIDLVTEREILLGVILVYAINGRRATRGIPGIQRNPEPFNHGIANVSFKGGQRTLLQNLPAVKRRVVGVEIAVAVNVNLPLLLGTEWLLMGGVTS